MEIDIDTLEIRLCRRSQDEPWIRFPYNIISAYLTENLLTIKTDQLSMAFLMEVSDAEENDKKYKREICYNSEGKEVEII